MSNYMINTVFNKAHGFARKKDKQIAIDLPRLIYDEDVCDLGNVIRVFGDPETLEEMIDEEKFNTLIQTVSGVKKTKIKKCSDSEIYFTLKRNRSIDKKENRSGIKHPYLIYKKDGKDISIYFNRVIKEKDVIFNSFGMIKGFP